MLTDTILVVDDTDDVRALTGFVLQEAGFRVIEAANGEQALALAFGAQQPDLVILDIQLPDIDGFEVCRRLRAAAATAAIPVLHLSAAYRGTGDRVRGLEGGADAYLTHPVEPEELVATARALLRIRRAESEARETQTRYRRLLDAALEGIWMTDAEARTTYVNQPMAAMLGYSVEDMLGRWCFDFMAPPAVEEARRAFDRARGGTAEHWDSGFRRKDGSELWAIVSTVPLLGDDGTFLGILALVIDITDRKRAERAERRAEALRTVATLAHTAAHEINNPLTVIVGSLGLVQRQPQLEPSCRLQINRALQAAVEIQAILGRLSRIARLEMTEESPHVPPMLDLARSSAEEDPPAVP